MGVDHLDFKQYWIKDRVIAALQLYLFYFFSQDHRTAKTWTWTVTKWFFVNCCACVLNVSRMNNCRSQHNTGCSYKIKTKESICSGHFLAGFSELLVLSLCRKELQFEEKQSSKDLRSSGHVTGQLSTVIQSMSYIQQCWGGLIDGF